MCERFLNKRYWEICESRAKRSGVGELSDKRFTTLKWWRDNKQVITMQKLECKYA